jgi:hypothetical protein
MTYPSKDDIELFKNFENDTIFEIKKRKYLKALKKGEVTEEEVYDALSSID